MAHPARQQRRLRTSSPAASPPPARPRRRRGHLVHRYRNRPKLGCVTAMTVSTSGSSGRAPYPGVEPKPSCCSCSHSAMSAFRRRKFAPGLHMRLRARLLRQAISLEARYLAIEACGLSLAEDTEEEIRRTCSKAGWRVLPICSECLVHAEAATLTNQMLERLRHRSSSHDRAATPLRPAGAAARAEEPRRRRVDRHAASRDLAWAPQATKMVAACSSPMSMPSLGSSARNAPIHPRRNRLHHRPPRARI